ncbi:hypothetical protein [Streptomyces cavernicola]|uniref:Uncharacterized protein n=1 Tax=Streptomyces cavernicola TaxID=3043613 RepID=A0ABT6SDN1_9ACTN|nr:hypothetical protein [Streptomyces sp. B-S-A6]MDI3406044.1 hypothetical protein [Streptomyces sp. B-S-A6]
MPTWRQDSNGDVTGDITTVVISGNTGGMVHLGNGDQIVHVHNDDDTSDDD